MKKFTKYFMMLLILSSVLILTSCDKQEFAYDDNLDSSSYNQKLFYRNDLLTIAPDPSVIQITEGEEKGWFYMYATSNEISCSGVQVWKSKDLNLWECVGVAFTPEEESWCQRELWAPEVIYHEGKYYMTVSGRNRFDSDNKLSINLAVADNPTGPFIQWTGTTTDGREVGLGDVWMPEYLFDSSLDLIDEELIDGSFFVDDDGKIYFYFCCTSEDEGSSIYGIELDGFSSPKYDTVKQLTRTNRTNVTDEVKNLKDEGYVNEGPHMIKHNDQYYLTYSINFFWNKNYAVKQAISTSPLGTFTKVANEDGGYVISAIETNRNYVDENGEPVIIDDYDQMSGTGHHCFIRIGNEVYTLYHAHMDRVYGGKQSERAVALDKVQFVKNSKGQEVLYVNGPTWSVQPLPSSISGYENIATKATVKATNTRGSSSESYLNDGLIRMHNDSVAQDFIAEKGTEITLEFDKYYSVRAIMIYNSYYYDKLWDSVDEIIFHTDKKLVGTKKLTISNLGYDKEWHTDSSIGFVRAGGSAIAEFNEIPVNKITIKINSDKPIAVGEITVLGREVEQNVGGYNTTSYSYQNENFNPEYWRNFDVNEGINVDGVIDEDIWAENNWFSFEGMSSEYQMDLTTFFGAEGIYFAAKVKDANVSWNVGRPLYQNSSIELMFCPAGTSAKNYNTVQLRVGLNGKLELYRGFYCGHGFVNDGYQWTIAYYDAMAKTNGLGFEIEQFSSEISKVGVEGYVVEAYVPFASIGLTERPASILCMPSFNSVSSYETTSRTSNLPYGLPYDAVGTYFTFDSYGVVLPEEGNTMGYCNYKMQTSGWDTSKDTETTKSITQNGSEQQYIFFKDLYDTKYYAYTYVNVKKILNADAFPKFGIVAANKGNALYYCVEASDLAPDRDSLTVSGSLDSLVWNWGELSYSRFPSVTTGSYTGYDKVKLGVVRDGSSFYFYVNDKYTGKRMNVSGFGEQDKSYVGLLTMNIAAEFSDYGFSTDDEVIDNMILKTYGDTFGDSVFGQVSSSGFSYGDDHGDNPFIVQSEVEQQYTYLLDAKSTNYMFTTKITASDILNNDPNPKFGIIAGTNGGYSHCFMIDAVGLANSSKPIYVSGIIGTGDYNWNGMITYDYTTGKYTDDGYVELTVIRQGELFYLFVNGNYVAEVADTSIISATDATTPGLLTMNIAAKYFDYSYTEDASKINAYLEGVSSSSILGNACGNIKGVSGGFDISTEESGFVVQTGSEQQWVFFKNSWDENFVIKTKVTASQVLNSDQFPKFGLFAFNNNNTLFYNIEAPGLANNSRVNYVTGKLGTSEWDWNGLTFVDSISTGKFTGEDYVELSLVKNNGVFYLFVNGQYATKVENIVGMGADDKAAVGFLTMNIEAKFFDYFYSNEIEDINNYLATIE